MLRHGLPGPMHQTIARRPSAPLLALVVTALLSACSTGGLRGTSVELHKAPAIKGTLHLFRRVREIEHTVITVRDGKVVRTGDSEMLLRARDFPEKTISLAEEVFGGTHTVGDTVETDATACQPLAISPHGINVACLRIDGMGTLTLFRLANPDKTQRNMKFTVGTYSTQMMGFLSDNLLAVVVDDDSCPFYRRADGQYADEPQARFLVINMRGVVQKSGHCVHGVVVGDNKVAYLSHDLSGNATYSLNGRDWLVGYPTTFDGSGQLLFIDGNNLLDQRGRLIASNVDGAYWTK